MDQHRDPIKVRDAIAAALKPLATHRHEHRIRERRYLLGGNAGGLIATLSLAGTIISGSDSQSSPLPWLVFCVIIQFLIGLAASGVALFAERGEQDRDTALLIAEAFETLRLHGEISSELRPDIQQGNDWRTEVLLGMLDFSIHLSRGMLIAGAISGLVVLSTFTTPPAWLHFTAFP